MNPDLLTELESIAYAQVYAWNAWRQHCAEHGIAIDSEPEGNEILALAAKSAIAALPAALEALALARSDAEKYRRVLEKIAWTIGAGDDGGLGWDQGTALREIARDALTVANTYDADHPTDCAGPDRPW